MKKQLSILILTITAVLFSACGKDSLAEIEERIKTEKEPETRTQLAEYARQLRLAQSGAKFDDKAALGYSAKFGYPENAEFFISKGADVNTNLGEGNTVLHVVARFCRPKIARLLIEKGADVNAVNSDGETPLLMTVSEMSDREDSLFGGLITLTEQGKRECERKKVDGAELFSILLESGADVNRRSRKGESPLSEAVLLGNFQVAEKLLKSGADIETTMPDGEALIVKAVERNDISMIDVLLNHGANINERHDDKTLLQIALEQYDQKFVGYPLASHLINKGVNVNDEEMVERLIGTADAESIKFLLRKGLNPKITKQGTGIPLVFDAACKMSEDNKTRDNLIEIIKAFVEAGADVELPAEKGRISLLNFALGVENIELVKFLLEHKANPNGTLKNTPVIVVAACNGLDFVKALHCAGADLNIVPDNGVSALAVAIEKKDLELLNYLLNHGVNPNQRLKKGVPAVAFAVYSGLDFVKALHCAGADLNAVSDDGASALSLAIRKKDLEQVNYLLEQKADANQKVKGLRNLPLVAYAVSSGLDFVKALHCAGADLNAVSDNGTSALSKAVDLQEEYTAKYLLANKASSRGVNLFPLYPKHRELIKLLIPNGADLNRTNSQNQTLLYMAVDHGDNELVKDLLLRGANPNTGESPLVRAYASLDYPCCALLVGAGADSSMLPKLLETIKIPGRNYAFGKYEVTQAQYKYVMGENPAHFKGDNLPVEQVSWNDAVEFCKKLTERERSLGQISQTQEYRLPSSEEWEHACRAGTTTKYYTGDSESDLERAGWYRYGGDRATHLVGAKQPNAFGLHDMHGNVWEWTSTPKESNRVVRGGSWADDAFYCGASNWLYFSPEDMSEYLGFRVVLAEAEE